MNATAKTTAFEIMKKKRNWHETVIQKRISHMENTTEDQEPATGTGTLPDVDDDEIQVIYLSLKHAYFNSLLTLSTSVVC